MTITDEATARRYIETLSTADAVAKLREFEEALRAENELQNLVARGSLGTIWQRHFADSAQLLQHAEGGTGPWLDIGTGAGFPGLVIAILRPQMRVILVESRTRRVAWLDRQIRQLGLPRCTIIGKRLEAVEDFEAEVISARAFAPLPRLVSLSARFSTARTRWVLPKGRSAAQEASLLQRGVRAMFHVERSLTDPEAGIIVGTGRPEISK